MHTIKTLEHGAVFYHNGHYYMEIGTYFIYPNGTTECLNLENGDVIELDENTTVYKILTPQEHIDLIQRNRARLPK